jgi:hypothetical protein
MFEFDILQRLKRLAYLDEQMKQGQLLSIDSVSNCALMKELSKMEGMEREKFADELFSEYCNTCLSKRPCYCMRDD